ncbi:MAG TPA: terminase [Gallionellaceae bacterium]|nr:terminase [Gallionellaceae bacterium]
MPPRSKIKQLPTEVKAWLDRALVQGNFSGYELLEQELAGRGFVIGKSSINRYGQEFEQRMRALKLATEQAKAISESVPDDEGSMNDALIRLVQQKAFETLLKMEEGAPMKEIGLMVARLSNATVKQKQWATEVRAKAESAASAVEKIAKKGGLSASAVKEIRSRILGIPS